MANTQNDVKRVYCPISKDLAVATDEALVNGKSSNLPLGPGEYEIESIEDLKKAGYPIDDSRSLVSGRKGQMEEGHFEFRLFLSDEKSDDGAYKNEEKALVKIGGVDNVEGLEVSGGVFGEDTLTTLAQLARNGAYLKITGMYLDADDDKHYTSKMTERHWQHDGTTGADRNIFYPKASSNDNQTNIRSIVDLDAFLDGAGYLEMPIYRGVGVNVTISTEYASK